MQKMGTAKHGAAPQAHSEILFTFASVRLWASNLSERSMAIKRWMIGAYGSSACGLAGRSTGQAVSLCQPKQILSFSIELHAHARVNSSIGNAESFMGLPVSTPTE